MFATRKFAIFFCVYRQMRKINSTFYKVNSILKTIDSKMNNSLYLKSQLNNRNKNTFPQTMHCEGAYFLL